MEIPTSQVRPLMERGGAARIGEDALKRLGEALEEVALEVAEEAVGRAGDDGRSTVRGEDVKLAAGNLAVHSVDCFLPPSVVPEDVVERHFHMPHDDLNEVIKKFWKME